MNLRDQDCKGNHNTVEEEGDHVGDDFANKEKAVYNIHFLPKLNFLQKCKQKKISEQTWNYLSIIVPLPFNIYST